jgi:ligand-binding sensor domain-containing protein/signal transduction histidine kinase
MELVKSIYPWKSVIQTTYDIIKAHGGELKVETKEGEGSEFIILLPCNLKQQMKFFIKISVLILLCIFSSSKSSYAQNESLRFEHLGFEDGLSHINVNTILQDSKGFIWIGTLDGLNKYDGYTFTKYKFDPLDPNSLSQNFIYTLWEDKQGMIWMGTFEGLCKFDRYTEKFTRYKPDAKAKFADPNITSISEDNNGMIWVGSASGGLCRFDKQMGKFLPEYFDLGFPKQTGEESELHDLITCIYKDRSGLLWIGNSTGLHQLTVKPVNTGYLGGVEIKSYLHNPADPNSLSSKYVSDVFEDHNGILWIATDNGLNSLDKERTFFTRYLHDPKNNNSISSNNLLTYFANIAEDQEGNLWISSANGLNKLNRQRTAFTTYKHSPSDDNSLSSNFITSVFIDKAGILWVGSWSGELNKANLVHKFFGLAQNVPGSNSLSNNNVTAILEDSSGIIWIGTYGGGLNRWDKKTNQFTYYISDPNNDKTLRRNTINGILEDRDKQLWVCNGEFLSKLNTQTGEFTHYNSNEAKYTNNDQREIYAVTEDHEGVIWLSTANGIKNFDKKKGKFIRHYYHSKADSTGISDYTAIAIFADSKDNIWVGYGSIATDRLDMRTGLITHYKHNPQITSSISSNIVNSFFEDSKGNLWLATLGGGLCYFNYKSEKFTTYTDKHGLPNNSVFSILEDNKNHLWLGTANGLSRFDPVTKKFTNYDYKDGLQGRDFVAGSRDRPARFKGKDGMLYFGGSNGFNFFQPDQIKADSALAPVVITQFKLFDKLVKGANETKEIVLKHNENYFSFEFSSLSYFKPEKNEYAYKLEGVDKDWVYSGTRRYVAYTNIGPGKFIFKVKATNSDGIWNEEGVSFIVIIRPPWWKTWWAYSVYGLLLIAALLAIHRYQKQKVIRVEREKAQKVELAQAKEIEKAYTELKSTQSQLIQSEKMASLGELTAGIAHEIQNPLNFVNNFSEVNTELIDELEQEADKGNIEEIKVIAKDIKDNEQKINHHGKRADAIVKGMLQHSRSSTGVKESTDINVLADEYLRLSYHGMRAKDKNFNAEIKTDFDNSIGKINIVPQDIGRVLLNIYNNSFYAVNEKAKDPQPLKGSKEYLPTITVSTKPVKFPSGGLGVELTVKDNGNGIPQKIVDKIFQPFFTTKPTGEGTGLGLSLAYDIIKAHGGEIKVETKEGEGSEFIIELLIA